MLCCVRLLALEKIMKAALRLGYVLHPRRNFIEINLRKSHSLEFNVKKFGELNVNTCKTDIVVDTIDCQKYPDQNIAFLKGKEVGNLLQAKLNNNVFSVVRVEPKDIYITPKKKLDATIQVPVKYNVSLVTEENESVTVKNLQNEMVDVTLDHGRCSLSNLLTDLVKVTKNSGNIDCDGTLHTNGVFTIKKSGNFFAKKLIGEYLQIKLKEGCAKIMSCYVENSSISTRVGNILIGQAHETCNLYVHEKGDVQIDSLDGNANVYVNEGNVEIFALKYGNISVDVWKGDVTIYLPEDSKTLLNIESTDLEWDKSLNILWAEDDAKKTKFFRGSMNCTRDASADVPVINISTKKGKVSIDKRSWEEAFLKKLAK